MTTTWKLVVSKLHGENDLLIKPHMDDFDYLKKGGVYSRRVEYLLDEVGHEYGTVAGDVGQSGDLAVVATADVAVRRLLPLVIDRRHVIVVVVQFVHVVTTFCWTRTVTFSVLAYTCNMHPSRSEPVESLGGSNRGQSSDLWKPIKMVNFLMTVSK